MGGGCSDVNCRKKGSGERNEEVEHSAEAILREKCRGLHASSPETAPYSWDMRRLREYRLSLLLGGGRDFGPFPNKEILFMERDIEGLTPYGLVGAHVVLAEGIWLRGCFLPFEIDGAEWLVGAPRA